MQLTPGQSFEQMREAIVGYLETAYKIASPSVHAERGEILRRYGTVTQAPFVEATPAFPSSHMLAAKEKQYDFVPDGLIDLVQHGVLLVRFPLWQH